MLTVVTFVKLPSIINPPNSSANGLVLSASMTQPTPPNGKKLTICVQGRQYIWRYTYGSDCLNGAFASKLPYSYQEMFVPANTTIVLEDPVDRRDPLLVGPVAGRQGRRRPRLHDLHLVQGAATAGAFFHGQCAQLCGRSHAAMIALVKVVTPAQYKAWLAQQRA